MPCPPSLDERLSGVRGGGIQKREMLHVAGSRLRFVVIGALAPSASTGSFPASPTKPPLNVAQRWTKPNADIVPSYLAGINRERLLIPNQFRSPTNLFDVSCVSFPDFISATSQAGVTTADLGARMSGRMVSQPRLEVNDWAGRGYAWTTLTEPFEPIAGQMLLHMGGAVEGSRCSLPTAFDCDLHDALARCVACDIGTVMQPEPAHHVVAVSFDRLRAQVQLLRDLFTGLAQRDQLQHFTLSR